MALSKIMPKALAFFRPFLCLAGAILLGSAQAQALRDYRCTIDRFSTSKAVSAEVVDFHHKSYFGREFTVERRTGMMAGVLKNSYTTKPEIIDLGSSQNAYKVVATMRREQGAGAGSNVSALVVNEYQDSSRKPFVFLDNNFVYFGTCVHF